MLTFRTPEEAVAKANNTPYGLSAGVWTENGSLMPWTASRLRAGVVWSNTFNELDPASPFGGCCPGRLPGRGGVFSMPSSSAWRPSPTKSASASSLPATPPYVTGQEITVYGGVS